MVPCFPYRLYTAASPNAYEEGVRIFPDKGSMIVNFPEQHYQNGVAKNLATRRRFKRMVRCLKRMENELIEREVIAAEAPSFLMECLMYRISDSYFGAEAYVDTFVGAVRQAWYATSDGGRCSGWREINDLKPMFKEDGGVFDRQQASDLCWHAFQMVEKS